jgi:hypothetical protein
MLKFREQINILAFRKKAALQWKAAYYTTSVYKIFTILPYPISLRQGNSTFTTKVFQSKP